MNNDFKTIDSHQNYSVSPDGKVFTNNRNRLKTPKHGEDGYLSVDLYENGVRTRKRIHRLVAEAYLPNPENKPDINHKDGNKHNNSVDNLEWCTKSENMIHAYSTGLVKPHPSYGMHGRKNPNGGSKGKPVKIIETGEEFKNIATCAKAINGNDRAICDCLTGRQVTHRGYHFERI